MNIFLTYPSAKDCALVLDDSRVIKMVLETAQLLSAVYRLQELGDDWAYKLTHANHPCGVWARDSMANFEWLCTHGIELANEYAYRFGKVHASLTTIITAAMRRHSLSFPNTGYTFDCSGQSVGTVYENYRECMRLKWLSDVREPRWTRRGPPDFGSTR